MNHRHCLSLAVLLLCGACVAFGLWQNSAPRPGGPISAAKTGWLFMALTFFVLLPAWLWRDGSLPLTVRRMAGGFFAGYVLRGLVEMPLLIWTHAWRTWHGISHNAVMLVVLLWLWRRVLPAERRAIHGFVPLVCAVLICESLNALLFGLTGSAEKGIYFAANDPVFVRINAITWCEIAVLLPALGWWLIRFTRWPA